MKIQFDEGLSSFVYIALERPLCSICANELDEFYLCKDCKRIWCKNCYNAKTTDNCAAKKGLNGQSDKLHCFFELEKPEELDDAKL